MSAVPRLRPSVAGGTASLIELPEYIITTFLPSLTPFLQQYPSLFRFFGVLLALWYFGPFTRLKALWNQFSAFLISTITVSSEEDLFGYFTNFISEIPTLRYDQSLVASSNPPQEIRRHRRHDPDIEEPRKQEDPKIKYEQSQGGQIFIYNRRLFYVTRKYGDGHTYHGNHYKRLELLSIVCLGRSTRPIKDLIEHIYFLNKDKERTLTIIRRPYSGGYGGRLSWSRLTSKPRRALDTVILNADQKEAVLSDMAEYMEEATMSFYASHGIPYRRGYLFHGPPGVGKTSFALAIASKFNLDVYNLSLLDQDLTDTDLVSLLNQLPGRSILLLEDVDSAGLNRKSKAPPRRGRRKPKIMDKEPASEPDIDSDEDKPDRTSRVTLSGLLNAIDGVAAPEGHILIMTTNKPYALDEALVRAGRISVRVEFQNATKRLAEGLFERMFIEAVPEPPAKEAAEEEKPKLVLPPVDRSEVPALAREFAAKIPDMDFSPADLQDYLLVHKKTPQKAVEELEAWMETQYEERRKKDEEEEVQRAIKKEKKNEEKKRFRDEVRDALKGVNAENGDDNNDGHDDEQSEEEKLDARGEAEVERELEAMERRAGLNSGEPKRGKNAARKKVQQGSEKGEKSEEAESTKTSASSVADSDSKESE